MNRLVWGSVAALAAIAIPVSAQSMERRATFSLRGDRDGGKCTVEVVVDGSAEVEVRGDTAILTNRGGQPPQWRRFECTGPMPSNPREFRFAGVDGRGRQELIRDPRNSRSAVVRIDDRDNGSEGYTFDLFWGNGGGGFNDGRDRGPGPGPGPGPGGPGPGFGDRGPGRRFTIEQAVRVCQDEIARQVDDRWRTRDINFRRTTIDDNPGRRDWVMGSFDVRRFGRDENYRFSCSVDFDNGRVRSASIDNFDRRR